MSKTDTQIILQGKKTGNKIVMNKLTVPAKEYMDKVEYTKKNAIAPIYKMNVNGEEVSIEKGANRTFTLNYEDGEKLFLQKYPISTQTQASASINRSLSQETLLKVCNIRLNKIY